MRHEDMTRAHENGTGNVTPKTGRPAAPREVYAGSRASLAWIFDVDERTVARWRAAGAPDAGEHGYSVRAWVAWWTANVLTPRIAPDADEGADLATAAAQADARKKIADASIAEEKLAALRGKLLDREQVELDRRARMAQFVAILTRACLELPPILAGKAAGECKRLMTAWMNREREEWLGKDAEKTRTKPSSTAE